MTTTLLLVHGAGGGSWEWMFWEEQVRATRPQWQCISLNLETAPGKILEETIISDYVEQVVRAASGVDRRTSRLILVGASLGGTLVAKASEALIPDAICFVCTTIPSLSTLDHTEVDLLTSTPPSPSRIKWSGGPLQETLDAIPDASLETCQYACERWRDESGAVIDAVNKGVHVNLLVGITPMLVVVPLADTTIAPSRQLQFANDVKATVLQYEDMSHVGPLLSTRAKAVAADVIDYISDLP